MANDYSAEGLEEIRALAARLLACVEGSESDIANTGSFRYRLIRGHALAMIDALDELAREFAGRDAPIG